MYYGACVSYRHSEEVPELLSEGQLLLISMISIRLSLSFHISRRSVVLPLIVAPLLGSVFLKFWDGTVLLPFMHHGADYLFMVYKYVPETNTRIHLSDDEMLNEKRTKRSAENDHFQQGLYQQHLGRKYCLFSLIIYISNAPFLFMEIHGFSSGTFSFIFAFNSLALITAAYITPKLIKE